MAANSPIEWTDHTFNPWTGCTAVSPGCDHCYAEAQSKRNPRAFGSWVPGEPRRRTSPTYWKQPLAWNRKAAAERRRARVFCASMAEVFDNQVPYDWRDDLWRLIAETQDLDWLLLTKRPQNIAKMLPEPAIHFRAPPWPWPHVWLGTTVENQQEADRRIPHLLSVPATVRFLSCEPLLGPVELHHLPARDADGNTMHINALRGEHWYAGAGSISSQTFENQPKIDWVICGGESGPKARPMHLDWPRSLRDQCATASVPFFFKQWGEWAPRRWKADGGTHAMHRNAPTYGVFQELRHAPNSIERAAEAGDGWQAFERVGKKAAGRLLDGITHDAFPSPSPALRERAGVRAAG